MRIIIKGSWLLEEMERVKNVPHIAIRAVVVENRVLFTPYLTLLHVLLMFLRVDGGSLAG